MNDITNSVMNIDLLLFLRYLNMNLIANSYFVVYWILLLIPILYISVSFVQHTKTTFSKYTTTWLTLALCLRLLLIPLISLTRGQYLLTYLSVTSPEHT